MKKFNIVLVLFLITQSTNTYSMNALRRAASRAATYVNRLAPRAKNLTESLFAESKASIKNNINPIRRFDNKNEHNPFKTTHNILKHKRERTIGLITSKEPAKLNYWFNKPQVIYQRRLCNKADNNKNNNHEPSKSDLTEFKESISEFKNVDFPNKIILATRIAKNVWLGLRLAIIVAISIVLLPDTSTEAPKEVIDFFHKESGRIDYKVFINKLQTSPMAASFNKLYITQEVSNNIEHILRFNLGNEDLNLYRGIHDHEIKGHMEHYHSFIRGPLFIGSFLFMDFLWTKLRNILEQKFLEKNLSGSKLKWLIRSTTRLILPTCIYLIVFSLSRKLISQSLEMQADAAVRNDIKVLKAVEKDFRKMAEYDKETKEKCNNLICKLLTTLDSLYSTHPSNEFRANYFKNRIEKLESIS